MEDPSAAAEQPHGCDGLGLRPDSLPAPQFQRRILELLAAVPGVQARSLGPFQIQTQHGDQRWDLRLDELFKRHRHGELTADEAAREVQAAMRLPEAEDLAAGPFPRLARVEALHPSTLRLPCPFDPDLAVFFVWELSHGHIPLTQVDLDRDHGGRLVDLLDGALAALSARTQEQPPQSQGEGDRLVLGFVSGDGFDAARALLPELLEALQGCLTGRLHLIIPSRDLFMVLGDADADFLSGAAAHARQLYGQAGDERLSSRLYAWTGESLEAVDVVASPEAGDDGEAPVESAESVAGATLADTAESTPPAEAEGALEAAAPGA